MINYIIPIKTSKEKGLCNELVESFHLTEPTSMLIERMKENAREVMVPFDNGAALDIYYNTTWGMTEEKLVNREHTIIQ